MVDADGSVALDVVGVEPGTKLLPDRSDGGSVASVADIVGTDGRLPDDGGLQCPILRHRGRSRLRALDDPLGVRMVPAFAPLGGGHLKAPFEHPDERRLRTVPAHTGDVGDGGAGVGDEETGGFLEPDRLDHLIEVHPHLRLEQPLQMKPTHPEVLAQLIDVEVGVDVPIDIVERIVRQFGMVGLGGGFHGFLCWAMLYFCCFYNIGFELCRNFRVFTT